MSDRNHRDPLASQAITEDARQREPVRIGLLIVNTGDGKGKTTAALGALFRAWGWGWRICVIQFIKSARGQWGEVQAARKLGIEWHSLGTGFTWRAKDVDRSIALARETWALAQEKILSDAYDLIILDEFTHLLKLGWLETEGVVEWLRTYRPPSLHVIITGRGAPPALIELADVVTEMVNIKHAFQRGIKAQRGIEF